MSTSTSAPPARRRLRAPSFTVQILLALVVGVLLGSWALTIGETPAGEPNGLTVALETIGSTFVSLLRATVPPLVFTAIVASIANLRDRKSTRLNSSHVKI